MTTEQLHRTSPAALLGLLREGVTPSPDLWEAKDYAGIWQQQLRAPLITITHLPDASRDRGEVNCLAQLLDHPQPPAELLRLMVQHAKSCVVHRGGELPEEVARVLYFLLIGVAHERGIPDASSLSAERLGQGLAWAVGRDWLDEPTRRRIERLLATSV